MLDIKFIREKTDLVRQALKNRCYDYDLDQVLELDKSRRNLVTEGETLKSERNTVSKEIGQRKKAGQDTEAQQAAMRSIGEKIQEIDAHIRTIEEQLQARLLLIPNIPHAATPVGPDASANRVVRTWGEKREFPFAPLPHWEIGNRLGMFDFERGTRMTGTGFPLYRGLGAQLERALINFMIDIHVKEQGYEEIWAPFVCSSASMTGTSQLPRLADDMYHIEKDDLYLIPTAEVPLTNIYREEIIQRPLPIYLTGYTPCFRREAGAAGRDTRGIIRVHQFNKVEMVKFVEPANSYAELETLVQNAEAVLQRLGLTYRVIELCTGDLSFGAAKCYDLELWAPGHNGWLEVSSCSNFEDFQARRAQIRYRDANGKANYVHTLNGSGVALPRLVVAILENGQQADGSVVLPEALRPYFGGRDRLEQSRA